MINSIKIFTKRYVTMKNLTVFFGALSVFFTLFFSYFYFTGSGKNKLPQPILKAGLAMKHWFTGRLITPAQLANAPSEENKEKQTIFFIFSNDVKGGDLRLVLFSNTTSPVNLKEIDFEFLNDIAELNMQVTNNKGDVVCKNKDGSGGLKFNVQCDGYKLIPSVSALAESKNDNQDYVLFLHPDKNISLSNILKLKLKMTYSTNDKQIKEVDGKFVDNTEFTNFDDIAKTSQEFLFFHDKFYLNSQQEFVLPAGIHTFSENVVIPKNTKLIINAGANINLINNASFISYSPVIAKGTIDNKIYVKGEADGKGENFAVLDNKGLSEFEYVEFSGGGESTVNGAFMSGMLAVQHADSIIKHCKFDNAKGDDSLNIKYASSTIAYNLFQNSAFDAIDYDFSDGVIEHNLFINNGNDSIDTSGSTVLAQYNDIINSGDKCISIGEKSAPIVFNNILNGCNIGIEIKDMSEPIIINNVIINNKIVGINEFQKKPIFGGGNGQVYNTIIWNNTANITLDKMSKISVNNSAVQGDYKGDDNFDKKPVFNSGFTNNEKSANIKYKTGGNTDVIMKYLKIKLDEAPVGLIYSFDSGI